MSSYYNMSIYIGNDLEDKLKILKMEYYLLRKYNEYHQVVHEIDHMSDLHADSSFYKQSVKVISPVLPGLLNIFRTWGGHILPPSNSLLFYPRSIKFGM